MEVAQSLDYNSIVNKLDFNVSQLDAQSFHADKSDYSKTLEDEMNNNNGTEETPFQNLTSGWLNDFISVGNGELFGCIDVDINEMGIGASEGFPDKTDSEDLANGLSISYTPLDKLLENPTGFTGSQAADTNNGQIIGEDFVLSNLDHLMNENKISPKKRKATETLTNNDEIDSFMEAFDEIEQDILDRPVELLNFGMRKSKQSDLVGLGGELKNMECIQPDPKRKRTKLIDTVGADEFITTNLASSKTRMQLFSEAGRGRNRNAKTRNRRSETGFPTDFEDLSPVSSPEAEVPSLSPININEYIGDDELMTLDTKELNRQVKFFPKAVVQEIKHRRRTLKNRGYARSCREKKIDETSILQRSNTDLENELACISLELKVVKMQCNEWKRKYEQLASACIKRARGIKH